MPEEVGVKFTADAGGLITSLSQAAKKAADVDKAVQAAKQKIVLSWREQTEAAKAVGASHEELAAIAKRAQEMLSQTVESATTRTSRTLDNASSSHKRLATAWTAENNRIVESEQAKQRALELAALKSEILSRAGRGSGNLAPMPNAFAGLSSFGQTAKETAEGIERVAEAGGHMVPPMAAASASLRALEGNFGTNLRAGERFASMLPGVQDLMMKAFPVIGAVSLGYALFEMGEKAVKLTENIVMLKSALQGLNALEITVGRTVQSDKDATEQSVEGILQATRGKSAALQQKYSYEGSKPLDMSSYFYADEYKKLPDNIKANYESLYKYVAPTDVPARLSSIRKELTALQSALATVNSGSMGAFVPFVNGYGPSAVQDPAKYYEARIKAAQQIQEQLQAGSDKRSAAMQQVQADIPVAQQEEAKKKSREYLEATRAAQEALKQQWELAHAEWEQEAERSQADEIGFWELKITEAQRGSQAYIMAQQKIATAVVAVRRDTARLEKENAKILSEMGKDADKRSTADGEAGLKQGAEAAKQLLQSLESLATTQQHWKDQLAETNILEDAAAGRISKHDEAVMLAELHTRQYARALEELQTALGKAQAEGGTLGASHVAGIQQQMADLNGRRAVEVMKDSANEAATSWQGALEKANNAWVQNAQDTAAQVVSIYQNALNGLNSNLVEAATGGKTNFNGLLMGLGKQTLTVGLQRMESAALGGLGKKADGSKGNPFHVVMDQSGAKSYVGDSKQIQNVGDKALDSALAWAQGKANAGSMMGGITSNGSGITSTLSSLAKTALSFIPGGSFLSGLFGGHRALGGKVQAGMTYDVGEMGREEFTPDTDGTITPASKLGSTANYVINVPNGVTPEAMHQYVQASLGAAHDRVVRSSVTAMQEAQKRRPMGAR